MTTNRTATAMALTRVADAITKAADVAQEQRKAPLPPDVHAALYDAFQRLLDERDSLVAMIERSCLE